MQLGTPNACERFGCRCIFSSVIQGPTLFYVGKSVAELDDTYLRTGLRTHW